MLSENNEILAECLKKLMMEKYKVVQHTNLKEIEIIDEISNGKDKFKPKTNVK